MQYIDHLEKMLDVFYSTPTDHMHLFEVDRYTHYSLQINTLRKCVKMLEDDHFTVATLLENILIEYIDAYFMNDPFEDSDEEEDSDE